MTLPGDIYSIYALFIVDGFYSRATVLRQVLSMRILLVHQNFPGQFCHLAHELSDMGHDVVALTDAANKQSDIVSTFRYSLTKPSIKSTQSSLAGPFSENTHRGEIAARAMVGLKENGFVPDLIIGHPGWGETLFCRDVFPRARLILHAEFYYGAGEADGSFDPEFQTDSMERAFRQRTLNATMLLAMVDADALVAPTRWQAGRFPALLQQKIHIAHEGIDTRLAVPNGAATLTLQRQGLTIKAGDEIVTFVSRNLEPYRGYHIFMRALPRILSERPNARAVIVGADGVSYGAAPGNGKSWKAIFRNEVGDMLPMDRVHFVGRIPHDSLITLFQISAAHVVFSSETRMVGRLLV
jgi:glycosyltransferase involved in cell wall biosynthesis